MGYYMCQLSGYVRFKPDTETQAFEAIRGLAGQETITSSSGRHFSWVDRDFATRGQNLEEILEEWRWRVVRDSDGQIMNMEFTGEKLGDDFLLMKTIAPFVTSDSCIEMEGGDGYVWRWVFRDGTCIEQEREHFYPDEELPPNLEKLLREFLKQTSIAKLWKEFRDSRNNA